jgi:hypothetical protein
MADNLPEHLYPTGDDSGDIRAPPSAAQFENLYNLVNQLLLKVDGDQTKPPAPTKQHNIPSVPADAVSEGGSVDEYATPLSAHYQARVHRPARLDRLTPTSVQRQFTACQRFYTGPMDASTRRD